MNILRICLRDPIPELTAAARFLESAVEAHLIGNTNLTDELIRSADLPVIRDWTESIWGSSSPYVQYRPIHHAPPSIPKVQRAQLRMPTKAEKDALLQRDGHHCRFCGIPVIRKEIREKIRKAYPMSLPWGSRNIDQHAAFQAMWLQYDHLLPHARGGDNSLDNMVITCAPCNFGRMNWTLAEVGLIDPRERDPIHSKWNGLEAFR